jgi:hypothetical protein
MDLQYLARGSAARLDSLLTPAYRACVFVDFENSLNTAVARLREAS